jgi:hypothetical protein
MRKLALFLLIVFGSTAYSSESKKDFHFNLGFGYSYVDSDLKDTGSLGIGLDVGFGLTEKFSLVGLQKNVFYEIGNTDIVHAVSALGVTFYLNKLYFTGAVGVANTQKNYSFDLFSGNFGDGYVIELGIELIPQIALEFYWTQANTTASSSGDVIFPKDHTTFNIAVVAMVY